MLIDFNMTTMGGIETTEKLKAMFKDLRVPERDQPKIIGMSGEVSQELSGISAGMSKVLQKPLTY